MQEPATECSNCEDDARTARAHALRISRRDETRTDLQLSLCDCCLTSLLELDWVTRTEATTGDER